MSDGQALSLAISAFNNNCWIMIWAEILRNLEKRLYCRRRFILILPSLVPCTYLTANLHLQTSEQSFLYYLLWLSVAISG
jgi:hypothetical protein